MWQNQGRMTVAVEPFKVLLVSTNIQASGWFRSFVEVRYPFEFETILSDRAALSLLSKGADFDLVIHDECASVIGMSGFIERASAIAPNIPVVALTQKKDVFVARSAFDVIEVSNLRMDFVRVLARLKDERAKPLPDEFLGEYLPSRIEALSVGGTLICDCYIKLSETKYVKMHRKGDRFDETDLEKFRSKNVSMLYIAKGDYDLFAAEIEKRLETLSVAKKLTVSRYLQECASDLYHQLGFSPVLEKTVSGNVSAILKTIEDEGPDLNALKEMISNPVDYQNAHGVVVAYVACGLAERLDWVEDQNLLKLTVAGLLHDLTLSNPLSAKFRTLDDLKEEGFKNPVISPRDIKEFEGHGEASRVLAQNLFPKLADVDKILVQHHETPDGKGYPRRLFANQIAPLAALFIVAHEIVHIWIDRPDFDMRDFATEYETWFADGAFKKIRSALEWENR